MTNSDYFNKIANKWDIIAVHNRDKIDHIVEIANISKGDHVIDIGTGTGILIPHILNRIGTKGKLIALDIAEEMIRIASNKHRDRNLKFVLKDYMEYVPELSINLIFAYSCFPHFSNRIDFMKYSWKLLSPQKGRLLIAHSENRNKINEHHNSIIDGPASDLLPPVEVLIHEAEDVGFKVVYSRDDNEYYILHAIIT